MKHAYDFQNSTPVAELVAATAPDHQSPLLVRNTSSFTLDLTSDTDDQADLLSKREIEIIKLVVSGHTSAEISEALFISEHTVRTHRRNIFKKLNIHRVTQLMKFAFSRGFGDTSSGTLQNIFQR